MRKYYAWYGHFDHKRALRFLPNIFPKKKKQTEKWPRNVESHRIYVVFKKLTHVHDAWTLFHLRISHHLKYRARKKILTVLLAAVSYVYIINTLHVSEYEDCIQLNKFDRNTHTCEDGCGERAKSEQKWERLQRLQWPRQSDWISIELDNTTCRPE